VFPARLILDGVAALQLTLKHKNFKDMNAILKAHFAFYGSISGIIKKRNTFDAPYTLPKTIFSKSILIQYFLMKKKKFSELE
jgi:hypothetical protein